MCVCVCVHGEYPILSIVCRRAPFVWLSSRPSRSAKSAATMQLLSAADRDSSDDNDDEDDEEEDDSGNESEGDEAMELVDSKDVFSSSAEPSSESQDTRSPEREESAPAKGGRSRALKQTTLTGSVVTGSSRRGGGARSQQRQDSSENRIRSPTKPTSRSVDLPVPVPVFIPTEQDIYKCSSAYSTSGVFLT